MSSFATQEDYEILGLTRFATATDIRRQYLKLSKEIHPDKKVHDPEATHRFQRLNAAYQTLTNLAKPTGSSLPSHERQRQQHQEDVKPSSEAAWFNEWFEKDKTRTSTQGPPPNEENTSDRRRAQGGNFNFTEKASPRKSFQPRGGFEASGGEAGGASEQARPEPPTKKAESNPASKESRTEQTQRSRRSGQRGPSSSFDTRADENQRAELLEIIFHAQNRLVSLATSWTRTIHQLRTVESVRGSRDIWTALSDLDHMFLMMSHTLEGMKSSVFPLTTRVDRQISARNAFPSAQADTARINDFVSVIEGRRSEMSRLSTNILDANGKKAFDLASVAFLGKVGEILGQWQTYSPRADWPERMVKGYDFQSDFVADTHTPRGSQANKEQKFDWRRRHTEKKGKSREQKESFKQPSSSSPPPPSPPAQQQQRKQRWQQPGQTGPKEASGNVQEDLIELDEMYDA